MRALEKLTVVPMLSACMVLAACSDDGTSPTPDTGDDAGMQDMATPDGTDDTAGDDATPDMGGDDTTGDDTTGDDTTGDDTTGDDATGDDATGDDATADMAEDTAGDGMDGPGNIVEVAQEAGQFSTLLQAAQQAGLASALEGEGPFTVFAPTDDAFESLDQDPTQLSDEELQRLLENHVVQGNVGSGDLPSDPPTVQSMAGLALWFDTSDGVEVNQATVTNADVQASNGVIHVVDSVLLPPDVPDMAGYAGLSSLSSSLGDAGLVEPLRGEGPFTVFAPTDDAFDSADLSGLSDQQLTRALRYHVLAGSAIGASDIPTDPPMADSMATNDAEIPLTLWFDTSEGVQVNGATVTIADIQVTNGVLHVVDQVLLPPDVPAMANLAGLSSLESSLSDAGLVESLQGEGPFTVFAPSDQAFSNADLSGLSDEELTQALLYHVVSGSAVTATTSPGDTPVFDSMATNEWDNPLTLWFSAGDGVTVNDAAVTMTDIGATNGVIHVVDSVLLPPNTVEMAQIAGLTELTSAAGEASGDLPGTLSGEGPFTVLAPSNQAFMDASDTLDGLSADQLRDALLYHVLSTSEFSEPVAASDVPNMPVPTELGQSLTASNTDGVQFTDENDGTASVVIPDIHTTNGVTHVLDAVLVPNLN